MQREKGSRVFTTAPREHCTFSHQQFYVIGTNTKPQAPYNNMFIAVISNENVIVICGDPGSAQGYNIH